MTEGVAPVEKPQNFLETGEFKPTWSRPDGVELIWFKDIRPLLDDDSLVGGMLTQGGLSMIVGRSGAGKTFLALDMGLSVADGREWFGNATEQGGVVYIAAEAGETIKNRVYAYREYYEGVPDDLPFAVVVTPVNLGKSGSDMYAVAAAVDAAVKAGIPIRLIIVDTMSRATPGSDENSSEDMTAFISNMDQLRKITGAHITLVHHHGKDADRGARGHSSLFAAVDTEITVKRDDGTGISTATVTKQRDMGLNAAAPISYRLEVVELGRTLKGVLKTSCICLPADGVATAKPDKPAKNGRQLADRYRAAFEQLKNCIAIEGQELPASTHVPAGMSGVTFSQWRGYLEMSGLLDRDGANPRTDFKRIREVLSGHGLIAMWGDCAWLVPQAV